MTLESRNNTSKTSLHLMIQYSFKWQRCSQRIGSATLLSYATYQSLFSLHQVTISNKVLRLKKKTIEISEPHLPEESITFPQNILVLWTIWGYIVLLGNGWWNHKQLGTVWWRFIWLNPQSLTVRPQVADRMGVSGYNTECLSMDHNGYIVCRVLRSTHVNNHFVDFSKGSTVFVFIHSPW